jgi:hypothetical protein
MMKNAMDVKTVAISSQSGLVSLMKVDVVYSQRICFATTRLCFSIKTLIGQIGNKKKLAIVRVQNKTICGCMRDCHGHVHIRHRSSPRDSRIL